jgi:hypothetical protein
MMMVGFIHEWSITEATLIMPANWFIRVEFTAGLGSYEKYTKKLGLTLTNSRSTE